MIIIHSSDCWTPWHDLSQSPYLTSDTSDNYIAVKCDHENMTIVEFVFQNIMIETGSELGFFCPWIWLEKEIFLNQFKGELSFRHICGCHTRIYGNKLDIFSFLITFLISGHWFFFIENFPYNYLLHIWRRTESYNSQKWGQIHQSTFIYHFKIKNYLL